jgi:hypothetical protein
MRLALVLSVAVLAISSPVFADDAAAAPAASAMSAAPAASAMSAAPAAPSAADVAALAAAKAAIKAAALPAQTDMNMWCAAAFTAVSGQMTAGGDAANAKLTSDAADALFTMAAPELATAGVAAADMPKLSTDYTAVAYAQVIDKAEQPTYTQDQCETAAKAGAPADATAPAAPADAQPVDPNAAQANP